MNQYPKVSGQAALGTDDCIVRSEHQIFANYAQKLSSIIANADWSKILQLSQLIHNIRNEGRRVYLVGNGGSAANAVHIANDLVYAVAEKTGEGVDAIALSSNTAVLTCLGNDVGFEHIYSEQLAVSGKPGDLLIALSGSGNSQNIVNALQVAKKRKMHTSAILGFDGGVCKRLAELPIHFNIEDMQIAEDLQLTVGHMMMKWLKYETLAIQPGH